jgi:hypothetical protein
MAAAPGSQIITLTRAKSYRWGGPMVTAHGLPMAWAVPSRHERPVCGRQSAIEAWRLRGPPMSEPRPAPRP